MTITTTKARDDIDFEEHLLRLTAAAHDRLDRAGVDRYSSPVPWDVARTSTLTGGPWCRCRDCPTPKERNDA